MSNEGIKWVAKATLEKREGDINQCKTPEERVDWLTKNKPYETSVHMFNLLLNEGMDTMLALLTGYGSETEFNNTYAQIGVGDSTTAAVRTQTGLQAPSNKLYKAMEATYPTAPAENDATNGRSIKFKSSFGDSEANFTWNEWSVRNGASADKNLNRKVENLGTKTGGTWTLTVEISLS